MVKGQEVLVSAEPKAEDIADDDAMEEVADADAGSDVVYCDD